MSAINIAIRYTLFALLATLCNLLTQELTVTLLGHARAVLLGVGFGTLVGILVKYSLDQRYIFGVQQASLRRHSQLIGVYSLTAVLTTALFWAFEFGFDALFQNKAGRYLGACIGLGLGYGIKYRLDKHFVFRSAKG